MAQSKELVVMVVLVVTALVPQHHLQDHVETVMVVVDSFPAVQVVVAPVASTVSLYVPPVSA